MADPPSLDWDLRELLDTGLFADLTFLVGPRETMFRAHSFIFGMHSLVF